jgi:hypothetical protein
VRGQGRGDRGVALTVEVEEPDARPGTEVLHEGRGTGGHRRQVRIEDPQQRAQPVEIVEHGPPTGRAEARHRAVEDGVLPDQVLLGECARQVDQQRPDAAQALGAAGGIGEAGVPVDGCGQLPHGRGDRREVGDPGRDVGQRVGRLVEERAAEVDEPERDQLVEVGAAVLRRRRGHLLQPGHHGADRRRRTGRDVLQYGPQHVGEHDVGDGLAPRGGEEADPVAGRRDAGVAPHRHAIAQLGPGSDSGPQSADRVQVEFGHPAPPQVGGGRRGRATRAPPTEPAEPERRVGAGLRRGSGQVLHRAQQGRPAGCAPLIDPVADGSGERRAAQHQAEPERRLGDGLAHRHHRGR